jgi:hypothetical protein
VKLGLAPRLPFLLAESTLRAIAKRRNAWPLPRAQQPPIALHIPTTAERPIWLNARSQSEDVDRDYHESQADVQKPSRATPKATSTNLKVFT